MYIYWNVTTFDTILIVNNQKKNMQPVASVWLLIGTDSSRVKNAANSKALSLA